VCLEVCDDAPVAVGDAVVCFIDDDDAERVTGHLSQSTTQGLDAGDGDLRAFPLRSRQLAAVGHLHGDDVITPDRDLVARLLHQLLSVREDQHGSLGNARDLREENGLARSGGHHDEHAAVTLSVALTHRVESIVLIGS
jgi:hypothetical protein